MPVRYTPDERLVLIKLRYRHHLATNKEIMNFYNNDPTTVKVMTDERDVTKIKDKFERTKTLLDCKPTGRPKSATNDENSASVLAFVESNPHTNIREVAAASGCSDFSVHKILKDNRYTPYKQKILHEMKPQHAEARENFSYRMLDWIYEEDENIKLLAMSDEATVFLRDEHNRQNFRWWSKTNPNWMAAIKSASSPKLNIYACIFGNKVLGPYFFDGNINGDGYFDMLKNFLIPEMQASCIDQGIDFDRVRYQHDGAPPHIKRNVRALLDATFPGRWIGRYGPENWPAYSPDLTSCDFFLWGYMRQKIFTPTRPTTIDELKDRIIQFMASVTPEQLENVRQGFVDRIGTCAVVGGQHIEHLR